MNVPDFINLLYLKLLAAAAGYVNELSSISISFNETDLALNFFYRFTLLRY